MGSGKSSVSSYLRQLGYAVFDSDAIVHELYSNDKSLIQALANRFGNEILHNNSIYTSKLREMLVEFPEQRKEVEKLVHPRVLAKWLEFCRVNSDRILFGEIPLLFEVGWDHYFDEIWYVYSTPEVISERLKKYRRLDEETISEMLKWQMDPQKKCAKSTFVLYNNTELKSVYDQIDAYLLTV